MRIARWTWAAERRGAGSVSLLSAVVFLGACGGASPSDQAEKEAQSLISSAATIRMTAESWLSGAVPDAFANKTLQKVEQALEQESTKLTSNPLPPGARNTLLQADGSMRETADAVRTAIGQHARAAVAPHLQRLSATEQRLLALERASAAQSSAAQ